MYEEKMTTLPELLTEVLDEFLSVGSRATSSTQELQPHSFPSLKDKRTSKKERISWFLMHFVFEMTLGRIILPGRSPVTCRC